MFRIDLPNFLDISLSYSSPYPPLAPALFAPTHSPLCDKIRTEDTEWETGGNLVNTRFNFYMPEM
jgi:hypothetical protein